ncbi:MAG: hypothetical protein CMK41_05630 [Porticoccaceae bacterium]|nr:hypothetical protein [Porticoccaceae bacterium]|tara:strand:- start:605 stop:1246 length:642 start_codon:yes stop_codon:yes gene_type:complete
MLPRDKLKGLNQIEKIINSALKTDPETFEKLLSLKDNIIVIESSKPSFTLVISVDEQGIKINNIDSKKQTVHVSGSLIEILRALINQDPKSALADTNLNISGDLKTLQKLGDIGKSLDIDWEGILGKIIGKIPARLFCKTFIGLIRVNNKVSKEITKNMIESIQEEVNIVPSLDEFTELSSNIRNLATNADRLEARIKKLKAQVVGKNTKHKQ